MLYVRDESPNALRTNTRESKIKILLHTCESRRACVVCVRPATWCPRGRSGRWRRSPARAPPLPSRRARGRRRGPRRPPPPRAARSRQRRRGWPPSGRPASPLRPPPPPATSRRDVRAASRAGSRRRRLRTCGARGRSGATRGPPAAARTCAPRCSASRAPRAARRRLLHVR